MLMANSMQAAVQKEAFSLAGLLANVSVQNRLELVIKTVQDGVLRQVREGDEDLSDVTTRAEELPRQNRVSRLSGGLYATVRTREASLPPVITSLNEYRLTVITVPNEPHLNVISSSNEDFSDISTASNEDLSVITTREKELALLKMVSGTFGGVKTHCEGFCGVTTRDLQDFIEVTTRGYEGFSIITTRGREGFLGVTTREEDFNYITTRTIEDFITVTTRGQTVEVSLWFSHDGREQVYRYFATSTHKAGIEFLQSIKRDCSELLREQFQDTLESEFLESIKKAVIEFCESIKKGHIEFRTQYAHVRLYGCAEFSDTLGPEFSESIKKECAGRLESVKKNLPLFRFTVYGNSAPAKSGAGIGVPELIKATHDAPSVFFCVVRIAQPFFGSSVIIRAAYQIMVGCSGAEKSAPASLITGYANPVQSTTSEIGVSCGGYIPLIKEAAIWLLPLPQEYLLSGLLAQFAAIARQSQHKSIISKLSLSVKLAVCWPVNTSPSLPGVSARGLIMLNQFTVLGYGTNQRGLTVGINYQITSDSTAKATAHAMLQAQRNGLTRITITRVMGATA